MRVFASALVLMTLSVLAPASTDAQNVGEVFRRPVARGRRTLELTGRLD